MDERTHVFEEEYTSDVSHQDGDLPHRMQITYEDGGPSYYVNDYFPHFHYQASAALADENYDLLIEYWGTDESRELTELEAELVIPEDSGEGGAAGDIPEFELDED